MLFKQPKNGQEGESFSINKSKWVLWLLVGIILISIAGYSFFSVKAFANKIVGNWEEIKFAFDKPNIVKAARIEYASKSAELEEGLLNKEPTPQDKLIEEVVDQLKTSKK